MIRRRHAQPRRNGAATVEMAVVLAFIMVPMMIGTWEMGRVVHVQQVVSNAAREGARLAAQGRTINANGSQTDIVTSIAPASNAADAPNVKACIYQTLRGAGLSNLQWTDVTVTFEFIDFPSGSTPGATEPYQGIKEQHFRVTVTIPYDKVRWVRFGIVNPTTISYSVDWRMMMDDPFTMNMNMPPW